MPPGAPPLGIEYTSATLTAMATAVPPELEPVNQPALEARRLRRQALGAPEGTVAVDRDELLDTLARSAEGEDEADRAAYAQAVLTQHGVATDPALRRAEPGQTVILRPSHDFQIEGAGIIALLAVIVGVRYYWLYGLVMAMTGAAGLFVVIRRPHWYERRIPEAFPRGRLLGASLMGALVILVGVAVILPIRVTRRGAGKPHSSQASTYVIRADASIRAHNLNAAEIQIGLADAIDPTVQGINDVRGRLVVARVRQLLADEDRRAGVFNEAEIAFQTGDTARAIGLMSSIRGFRDADDRLAAYRRAPAPRRRHR